MRRKKSESQRLNFGLCLAGRFLGKKKGREKTFFLLNFRLVMFIPGTTTRYVFSRSFAHIYFFDGVVRQDRLFF